MSNLIPPKIHLNGSSAEHLMEQYQKLSETLGAAIDAAWEISPNARDYYVIGESAHRETVEALETMVKTLLSFRTQVRECLESIQDQVDERKRR